MYIFSFPRFFRNGESNQMFFNDVLINRPDVTIAGVQLSSGGIPSFKHPSSFYITTSHIKVVIFSL
jgi:hypothetical protein